MTNDLTDLADARGQATPPTLRVFYDADLESLWALVPGEGIDGNLDDEVEGLASATNDRDCEPEDGVFLYRRGPGRPVIGFGVADAFVWALVDDDEAFEALAEPRFDVPTLALRGTLIPEIVLAARRSIRGSTPDALWFDRAVAAGQWAWLWRGRAAEDMGETAEAASCYRRAVACEQAGSYETDAEERLTALEPGAINAAEPDQGPGAIDRELVEDDEG